MVYNELVTIKKYSSVWFFYIVNGRSPLEWIIDHYQIKTDSARGIKNNPNDWTKEYGDEKYILDLILSCIIVSLKTLEIVENFPTVDFESP